jgi:nucleotide-binding universal stress UspA family protein
MAKRILVPLDLSPESSSVLPTVADMARGGSATVRLLHVAPIPDKVEGIDGRLVAYADQEAARLELAATEYLRSTARLAGLDVETAVRFGNPAEEIVQEAENFGADLIALATRPRGPLTRLILGSTSEQVCHRTDLPVLVYRPGAHGAG